MMDEEQHFERLDVENDYDGFQWIGGEAYGTKRQKRQQTADERLYGVFAEASSDEDDRPRKKKEAADYTKPVSFVSKGVIQKDEDNQKKAQQSQKDDDGAASTSNGLGFRGGLGSSNQAGTKPQDEDDDDVVLPSAFGKRVKQAAEARLREKEKEAEKEMRKSKAPVDDPEFAPFIKHSKGIGLKLLEKMGYKKGTGLGREQQGVVKPIEVKLRPKNMGMGFGDFREAGGLGFSKNEEEPKAEVAKAEDAGVKLWKRKNVAARVKREYRSAEDVLLNAEATGKVAAPQAILDLRGPQARVITNMEHLNMAEENPQGKKTPMPELQHNLQLIVDMTEAQLQKLDARLRHEQDTATILAQTRVRLQEEVASVGERVSRLANIMNEMAKCQARDSSMSLLDIERAYSAMRIKYSEEYVLFDLASAALAQALPRLQALMRGWQPFEQPRHGLVEFATWKELVENSSRGGTNTLFATPEDPYTLLVFEVLLPPLRTAILNQWEPRNPETLLGLLEDWEALLPAAAVSHILDMLVVPRLKAAVQGWEPRRETVPIHVWVHPWLQYCSTALEEVYPTIRYRLGEALKAWHPSDNSALLVLQPWQKVWQPADWEKMLGISIVPALHNALSQLTINPAQQNLDPFRWVMAWADALPATLMCQLLEAQFFPKWHMVLHHWLSSSPDYDEVTRWYLAWKTQFPQNVLDYERVRVQLNYALNLMHSAVEGQPLPPYQPPTVSQAGPAASASGAATSTYSGSIGRTGATDLSLKDLIAKFAEENGVQFLPRPARYHEGLQVYAFGNVSVVIDSVAGMIRAQVRDRWAPVSLETLLQESLSRGK